MKKFWKKLPSVDCDVAGQRLRIDQVALMREILLCVVKKRRAICDDQLKIPHLGRIDVRVIDFGDDAAGDGVPDRTGPGMGGSHPVLIGARPRGRAPRAAGGRVAAC